MLNYLNNKFTNLNLKIKIQLYLLPLMLIYILYYFSQSLSGDESNKIKNSLNINQYDNKKFDGSFLELLNKIESSSKQLNMQVQSLNHKNNIINLKVYTKIKDVVKLINIIENINHFTKISSISIYEKNDMNSYLVDFTINVNKYYLKKLKKNEEIFSEEKKKEVLSTTPEKVLKEVKIIPVKNIEEISYKLTAIIANFVLINDKWIKKGEKIDNFELIHINKNFVFLESNEKKIKLELINEEYLKRIY